MKKSHPEANSAIRGFINTEYKIRSEFLRKWSSHIKYWFGRSIWRHEPDNAFDLRSFLWYWSRCWSLQICRSEKVYEKTQFDLPRSGTGPFGRGNGQNCDGTGPVGLFPKLPFGAILDAVFRTSHRKYFSRIRTPRFPNLAYLYAVK